MAFMKQRLMIILALTVVMFAAQLQPALADNFLGPVTGGGDTIDTNDGVCTLREAMNSAFNNPDANDDCGAGSNTDVDVITFSVTLITLGTSETSLPNITDNNPNGVDLRIEAPGVSLFVENYAFDVDSGDLVINGMTIVGSDVAAIQTHAGTTTLNGVTLSSNHATDGGAIDNAATMTINDSIFLGNSADQTGGAIKNSGTMEINRSTFTNNTAGYRGGAINNIGTLTINATTPATTFNTNTVTTLQEFGGGGALFLDSNSITTINGVSFSGNSTLSGRGGAIYGSNFGAASGSSISGSSFTGNQNSGDGSDTKGDGGAFFVQGVWTVSYTTFSSNTALLGSGGAIAVLSQGNLTMNNSAITGNTAAESGSGISTQNGGTTTLTNVTVAANTGSLTAQLYNSSSLTLQNTLVANPLSGANCSGTVTDGGGNLQYPDATCVSATTGDPKLTAGYTLGAGSAATDIGIQSFCSAFTTDLAGNPRTQDGNGDSNAVCDAGAYEGGTNGKPTANADTYNTDEGTALTVPVTGVLGNDTDPENAQLTAVLESSPSNASSFTLNADGSFSYTPNTGYEASDSFTYRASDGASQSDPATVTITVNNAAPTANADSISNIVPDMNLVYIFDASVLLANDTDPGNDTLTIVPASLPLLTTNNGQLVMVGTTITYHPNGSGPDSFTYMVTDGFLTSAPATVSLSVNDPINQPPEITAIMDQETAVDTPITVFFTVSDDHTNAALLIPTGISDNTALVPNANIAVTLPCLENLSPGDCKATITPAAGQTGTANITFGILDQGGLPGTVTFKLTVSAIVNTAPTISNVLDQVLVQGANSGTLSFTIGDAETAATMLTVTATSSNQGLLPDANIVLAGTDTNRSITLNPVAVNSGQSLVTITVSDGTLTATDTILLTVNAPGNTVPTITNISNQVISVNTSTAALPFTISDAETAANMLAVSVSSSNQTLIPDINVMLGGSGANQTVTVTPAAGQTGTATITIFLSDGTAGVTETFLVTVNPVNTAPTISDVTDQAISVNTSTGALPFTIGDAETAAASLGVSASSSNQLLVPNASVVLGGSGASRTVTVTPAAGQIGTATITLTVNDGALSITDTFVVTVTAAGNTAPTISDVTTQTINVNTTTGALPFTIGDAETAAAMLTMTAVSNNQTLAPNAGIVFGGTDANRTVTVTPAAGQWGSAVITITVSDGTLTAIDTFTLTVNAPANTAPTISDVTSQIIMIDTNTGALPFAIGDTETAANLLTVTGTSDNQTLVPNVNIEIGGSSASRTVTVTPAVGQTGMATIMLTVSDGTLNATDTFTVTVNAPANTAPTIGDVTDQAIMINTSTAALPFIIGDVETAANMLTVSASSSNPMLVPNANVVIGGTDANRTVTVTPAAGQTGTTTITLTVSDGVLTANDTFTVTVNAPGNTSPTISNVTDQAIMFNTSTGALPFTIGDAETAATLLMVTASSNNQTLVPDANITLGGTDANRTVTVTPAANQAGTATITLTVSDGTASAADTFVLTVNVPGNTAPTISDIMAQVISVDTSTGALPFTIGDAETAANLLTVTAASSNQTLVPDGSIALGGSDANRTVTVTPAAGQTGTVTITLTVSDGAASATDTFLLTVNAAGAMDSDNDGVTDTEELLIGTNPNNPDSDGDGATDGEEVAANSNPLDPTSTPSGSGSQQMVLPPPPPLPPLTDYNGVTLSDIIRADVPVGIRYGVFGRIIARNGSFVVSSGQIGNMMLLEQGVNQAADIFTVPGVSMSEGVRICLQGTGTLYFMDAAGTPRVPVMLPMIFDGGYTCGMIFTPGMVVLTNAAAPTSSVVPVSSSTGTPLAGCSVTTVYASRLRADASLSAPILTIVPFNTTLQATSRLNGWYQVSYNGMTGWISGRLLSLTVSCLA